MAVLKLYSVLAILVVFSISVSSFTEQFLSGNYNLQWEVTEEKIKFKATAKTEGWVGIGLNSKGVMDGAELMIAGMKKRPTAPPTSSTSSTTTTVPTNIPSILFLIGTDNTNTPSE